MLITPLILCDCVPLCCCAARWLSLQVKKKQTNKQEMNSLLLSSSWAQRKQWTGNPPFSTFWQSLCANTSPSCSTFPETWRRCRWLPRVRWCHSSTARCFSLFKVTMRPFHACPCVCVTWCNTDRLRLRLKLGTIRSSVCIIHDMTWDLMLTIVK